MKTQSKTNNSLKTVFGPLWKLYSDSSINTLYVDSFDDVYYQQNNTMKDAFKIFKNENEVDLLVARLMKYAGIKENESARTLNLNIDLHTKVDIILRPVALRGPSIMINKLPSSLIGLDDFVKFKVLNEEGKTLITTLIEKGKGILVAGNPGSGKTTLLNALVSDIPQSQRVITIEPREDLILNRKRVCRLSSGNLVELVSMAERMFPDYLVNSSFEGPEVMPFLEVVRNNCSAMGLISGENPLDALKRLETKAVLSSEGMSLEDARYAISQSFKHVIFQEKREDGTRVISSINEIRFEAGELKLKVVYKS